MSTLAEQLLNDANRPQVVRDAADLVDREVKRKRGFKGAAIKAAYRTVKAIKPGFIPAVIDGLLDEWVGKLEGHYAEFLGAGGGEPLSAYLDARRDAVAERLLEVTDERAKVTKHSTASKVYLKLRPSAKTNVEEAVRPLGEMCEPYLAQ